LEFLIYIVAGTANGCLYALMALGLVLIYKTQSFVPFVNGEFFAAGAFIGLISFKSLALPYGVALAAGALGGGVVAALCERLTIRPISTSHHLSLVMVTAAVSITLQGLGRLQWGDDLYTFPSLFGSKWVSLFGAPISLQNVAIIVIAALLAGLFFLFFSFTSIGKKMRALSQNPLGAQLVGIDADRVRNVCWFLSGVIGGAAGVIAGPITLLYPDMGAVILMKGFAAAILGGLTSIGGSMLGGILLGITEVLVGAYISSAVIEVSSFLIIMLVLLVRPTGLFGAKTVMRV
jgi:branched-chain amino acid transport system permease protein